MASLPFTMYVCNYALEVELDGVDGIFSTSVIGRLCGGQVNSSNFSPVSVLDPPYTSFLSHRFSVTPLCT
jgi:hypothetical protein